MANPRNMRVQVDRKALIAAIERKQNQCRKEYERKGDKHLKEIGKWKKDELADMKEKVKHAQARIAELSKMSPQNILDSMNDYGSLHLKAGGNTLYPPKEREANQLNGYDTILRMLKMSKKDSVSLSEQQFKAYMDGCPV